MTLAPARTQDSVPAVSYSLPDRDLCGQYPFHTDDTSLHSRYKRTPGFGLTCQRSALHEVPRIKITCLTEAKTERSDMTWPT